MSQKSLTQGPVMKTMLRFSVPMILGNLLQQCYNVADTLIVGQFLGSGALAAVTVIRASSKSPELQHLTGLASASKYSRRIVKPPATSLPSFGSPRLLT